MMITNVYDYCDGEWWDYNEDHNFSGLIKSLQKEFECIGEGTHRIVFARNDRYVIKAPKSIVGLTDNWHEGGISNNSRVCRSRLLHNVLLIMERVRIPEYLSFAKLPEWTYGIDCCQVGITLNGKLKAYDYGLG